MSVVTNQNQTYSYERTGNPESTQTLVFVHGATMTGAGMAPLAAQFGEYNCITVDLPGHGNSQGDTCTTVEGFADAVSYLVEELQKKGEATQSVTVLGFSMGGCITVELALRQPTWLKRAVVLSSGADLKGNTPLVDTFNAMETEAFRAADLYDHLFGRYTTEEERKMEMEVLMATKCQDVTGVTDLRTACSFSKLAEAAAIKIPVLIIAGDDDEIVPVNIPIRLRDQVPGSELQILPYRGHSAIYEEMETVINTIKQFFGFHPAE